MSLKKAIFFLSLLVKGLEYASGPIYAKEFIIKVRNTGDISEILRLEPELKLIKEIIPRLCVFSKDPEDDVMNDSTYLSYLKQRLKDKVQYIEQAKLYFKSIEISERPKKQRRSYGEIDKHDRYKRSTKELVLQPPYYGLGIPEAWEKGNNGKGVVIGMTDVGVVTDIRDIQDKINSELSKSFVIDNWGIEPTDFPSYLDNVLMDHGNNCAGLIVGSMDNKVCTVGVAHEAQLAVLKIFLFDFEKMVINERQIAEALVYELDNIHIYSNSWSIDNQFDRLPQFLKDVLEQGAMKGREGKGRIYVYPPGSLAGGFANSPYTITVNAVGTGGRKTEFSPECACVLTTAYGEGHTNSSTEFITTSSNYRQCTARFKGTSPATAVVAGIVALLLQNNDHLTWREVQYLIIQSSSMSGILDTNGFVKNAAGRFYHSSYGYGLINATQLVSEAGRLKRRLPKLLVYNSQANDAIVKEKTNHEATWTLPIPCPCNRTVDECITTVEQVVVRTSFTTHLERETELTVISPSQTKSYLMRSGHSYNRTTKRENAEFLSVHFWGEKAIGNWTLILRKATNTPGTVSIERFAITLYGHMEEITSVHIKLTSGVIANNIYQRCQDMIVNESGVPASSSQIYIICIICISELIYFY